MAAKKTVSPAVTVIVIIVVLAIIFFVYWKTTHKPAPNVPLPGQMMQKYMGNMPGGAKGMPGGMMKGPMGPQAPTPPAGQ
jgi:cell division protein FtsN